MILRIDAQKVAHELALADTHSEFILLTRKDVEFILDSPDNSSIHALYTDKYDYYFEILTNHAL